MTDWKPVAQTIFSYILQGIGVFDPMEIRWNRPAGRGAWESSRARALHDDRCLRQRFIPCQVTEEIADKFAEGTADNSHYVARSDINTWNLTGGKGDAQP